jgi:hypothetical protein
MAEHPSPRPLLAFRATPAARQLEDGTWLATYAGLDLAATGATEDEAVRDLAGEMMKWMAAGDGAGDAMRAFCEAGGSADVEVLVLDVPGSELTA